MQAAGDKPYPGKSWLGKINRGKGTLGKRGNLARYAAGTSNEPEEEEEEQYTAGIRKQPARNPIGGNKGWENENEPTWGPSTLDIHGGRAGQFTKQETTFPEEGDEKNAGIKSRALHRVLMGENPILQNPIGGGNEWGRGKLTMEALPAGNQQGAGGGNTGWSALTDAVKMFGPAEITQEFSKKLLKWQADVRGESTKCATFKI